MKVLLIEQYQGGHYDNYLGTLLPALKLSVDEIVVAAAPHVARDSSALKNLDALPGAGRVTLWPGLPTVDSRLGLRDRLQAARAMLGAVRVHKPDHTLVSSADSQASGLAAGAVLGWRPLRGLGPIDAVFHSGFGSAGGDLPTMTKRVLYERMQRHCGFDNPGFVSFLQYESLIARSIFDPGRLHVVGDPVPQPQRIGRDAACRLLGLDPDAFYIGLLGALDTRKAVPELLAAFRAAALGPDHRLLLAGRLAPRFRALIDGSYRDLRDAGRLIVLDRFLSEAELQHGYEALDLSTPLYYRFPGLASLTLKALAAGSRVLVDDFGWMGALVRRFGVGTAIRLQDPDDCASGLRAAVKASATTMAQEPLRRLLAFHSVENFTALVLGHIWSRAGHRPGAPTFSWQWVCDSLAGASS